MAYSLLGNDFIPPDVRGKVTGRAKYAEDFRAEGMLFCRLLGSPMPHARVVSIDTSEALAMEGVVAVLTADDVPSTPAPATPILTNEPHFVGEPILAVAAVDEVTAQDAIDLISIEFEPLPFTVDPLESLYPGGMKLSPALRHVGLYAYRVHALMQIAATPPCELERLERLEQLRALWLGMKIIVAEACEVPPRGVDTEADLDAVRQRLVNA